LLLVLSSGIPTSAAKPEKFPNDDTTAKLELSIGEGKAKVVSVTLGQNAAEAYNLCKAAKIYADDDRRLAYKRANRLWHTDMSFYDVRATYSLLAAHAIPPAGADTEFVDMRAVYDFLPEQRKAQIEGLVVEHSYWHSRVLGGGPEPTEEERATRPPARHAMAHVHAPSQRKSLYLASHACGIVSWPSDKGRALIEELLAFATQPRFVYAHKWRLGDVLIWDNLATMHRATEFDDRTFRRDMRRTTCRERALA